MDHVDFQQTSSLIALNVVQSACEFGAEINLRGFRKRSVPSAEKKDIHEVGWDESQPCAVFDPIEGENQFLLLAGTPTVQFWTRPLRVHSGPLGSLVWPLRQEQERHLLPGTA